MSTPESKPTRTAVGLGVLAGLLAWTCCVGPAVLALLGLGTAAAVLGRYEGVFTVLALVLLAAGVVRVMLRRGSTPGGSEACCAVGTPRSRLTPVLLVLLAFAASWATVRYAILPALQVGTAPPAPVASAVPAGRVVELRIQGMTCASCAVGVVSSLEKQPGIVAVRIDADRGSGTVTFDASRWTAAGVAQRVSELGYPAAVLRERPGGTAAATTSSPRWRAPFCRCW